LQSTGKRKAPPKAWKPGQSGNPKGRAPAGTTIAELFRSYLQEPDPKKRMPRVIALANKLYMIAMSRRGNVNAAKALLEYGVPRPAQAIELNGALGLKTYVSISPEDWDDPVVLAEPAIADDAAPPQKG